MRRSISSCWEGEAGANLSVMSWTLLGDLISNHSSLPVAPAVPTTVWWMPGFDAVDGSHRAALQCLLLAVDSMGRGNTLGYVGFEISKRKKLAGSDFVAFYTMAIT